MFGNRLVTTEKLLRCACVRLELSRSRKTLSRTPVRVYNPKPGELKGREGMASVPKKTEAEVKVLERLKSSGDLFRSIMGEIHTSKNKYQVAIEGGRLLEEAIRFGLRLQYLFLLKSLKSYPDAVAEILEREKERKVKEEYGGEGRSGLPEVHMISLKTCMEWSAVETPPGIIGIFDKPPVNYKQRDELKKRFGHQVPLTIVLDNVREPGNLGSIMRTTAGIGGDVFLSKGCVDPWDMKALRGGNGAQFLVPMTSVDLGLFHQHINLSELISNGPKSERTGSGIGVFLADSGIEEDKFGIPIVPYTSIDYSSFKYVYLIVGGETHGLSDTVKKSVIDLKQYYPEEVKLVSRINIPMRLPIDSLNVANAVGVIGYEIARQFAATRS